jgi:hypothetical protein
MGSSLAATPVIAVPLALLFFLSGEVSVFAALAATVVIVFVILCAGNLLLRAVGAADLGVPAAWVLGLSATAVALLPMVWLGLLAASAFAIWALIVLALSVRFRAESAPAWIALALCGAATLFWCWDIARVPHVLARDGVLATWTDQFYHGATISQFGDPRGEGRGSNLLAGAPLSAYHYASYLLPAALAWPLDLPGLPLATSVWVPLGFFTVCAGAYVLGAALAGRFGGVAGLAALTLLPDAASYGLANRAFGYYWHQLEVPGGTYAVGACLVAFALLHRRATAASALLIAAALPLRLHVFLLAFPAWLIGTALLRGRKLVLGATAAGFALFVLAYYVFVPGATPAVGQFLELARNPYLPLYHTWLPSLSAGYAIGVGMLLLIPAILGVFAVLYPVSVLLLHRARRLERFDLVPLAVLVSYLLLVLTAPVPPHGDATELPHRPFVLLYAVIAIWTLAGLARWAEGFGGWRSARVRMAVVAIAALTSVSTLWYTVRDARLHRSYEVAAGLPQAARFIRANAQAGEVLAVQGLTRGPVYTDNALQLVALTGIPAYLSMPHMRATLGGQADEVERRYAALASIAAAQDAFARLRELGIQWYVVVGGAARPGWEPAFAAGHTAVYYLRAGTTQ